MRNKCLEQLIGLSDAADELGLQLVTMRVAADRGYIEAVKIGQSWVTTRNQVERYRRERLGKIGRPKGS